MEQIKIHLKESKEHAPEGFSRDKNKLLSFLISLLLNPHVAMLGFVLLCVLEASAGGFPHSGLGGLLYNFVQFLFVCFSLL